jgi:hypothetical protein
MNAITIPIRSPLTFDELRRLNPEASPHELADAFAALPSALREEAWASWRLHLALGAWNADALSPEMREPALDGLKGSRGDERGQGSEQPPGT